MSSVNRSMQQSSETTTKKKFGKNLNKLTKPPAPPTASAGAKSSASRNGLLLLSTKRPQSGTTAAASAGGILSSKSSQVAAKPLPSLGLQYESSTSTHDALLGAVVGASRAETQQPDAWGVAEKQKGAPNTDEVDGQMIEVDQSAEQSPDALASERSPPDESGATSSQDLPHSNWDEYGGRSLSKQTGNLHSHENNFTDQKSTMARMARERTETRRVEEEARQNDQRARAAQRLRELEEKMADDASSQPDLGDGNHSRTKHVLEARSHSMPEEYVGQTASGRGASQRTLYNPNKANKPFNSSAAAGKSDPRSAHDPDGIVRNGNAEAYNDSRVQYSRPPVIQLASYEDRDRGERGQGAAPRMLYDPKSGSMVAVPSRDEAASGARGRKERGKKVRNARDKELKNDSRLEIDGKAGRKGKRDKKGPESSPGKGDRRAKCSNQRALPRTRGVLYARDNKGNFVCADGGEGDLGYGAHSVPGGRAKNPAAYAKLLEEQKRKEDVSTYDSHHLDESLEENVVPNEDSPGTALQPGFQVPEPAAVTFDWVKPSDKLELITGIEDSPTLQATAKEWAPSQAALAAAAAVVEPSSGGDKAAEPNSGDSVAAADDEEDDDDDGPFGLGFDPTLNMDAVIHSPSAEPSNGLDTVDLTTLSLEPALQGGTKSNHIFAFGTGATWGTSEASGSNDWGVPSSGAANTFLSLSSSNTWGGVSGLGATSLGGSSLNGDPANSTGD